MTFTGYRNHLGSAVVRKFNPWYQKGLRRSISTAPWSSSILLTTLLGSVSAMRSTRSGPVCLVHAHRLSKSRSRNERECQQPADSWVLDRMRSEVGKPAHTVPGDASRAGAGRESRRAPPAHFSFTENGSRIRAPTHKRRQYSGVRRPDARFAPVSVSFSETLGYLLARIANEDESGSGSCHACTSRRRPSRPNSTTYSPPPLKLAAVQYTVITGLAAGSRHSDKSK
jgi:hypothetical protein